METAAAPQPETIRWSALTHPGRFRKNNEDAFLAITLDAREIRYLGKEGEGWMGQSDYVFAVSDGMGGAHSGEVASRIAVDKITHIMPASFRLGAQRLDTGFADVLREVFVQSNAAMHELSRCYDECRGMGATLSLCWFMPGWMAFGHVGDSRIYYLPYRGEMVQISHDDTRPGRLQREGKINEREARSHPDRHLLEQVLGGRSSKFDPQFGRVACRRGDRFLICSDGLVEGIWDYRIAEMASGELWVKRLIDYAVAESGRDNTTAILIELV